MSKLVCQFFGSPHFFVNGCIVKPDRRKAVALAAFLAVHGKPVSRERLADLLWPDYGRHSALASLRRTLSAMGKILGKFWFKADRQTICFVPGKEIHVDVLTFQSRVSRGGSDGNSVKKNEFNPQDLEQAALVYNSPFLSGFSLDDAPGFDDWQFSRKEELERDYIHVLKTLAETYEKQGHDTGAIKYASAWAAHDALNEAAHRCLIRLYGRSGQKSRVQQQYEKCRSLLDTELGIEPDPETSNLADQFLAPDQFPVKKISPPPGALPAQSIAFIGRHQELEQISTRLIRGDARLMTLTGPGGMGKTRLALQAMTRLSHPLSMAAFFVPLANVSTLDEMRTLLLKILGIGLDKGTDPQKQVLDFLRTREILLIMDNLEHLPGIEKEISHMLDKTRHAKILATSRSRLGLTREQVLVLSGLACPKADISMDTQMLPTLLHSDAARLFLFSIRRVRPDFKPNAGNAHDIIRVCRSTSAMPLALILAGGWGDVYCLRDIADKIEKSIDFLHSDDADLLPAHGNMRAVFDTSWNSLRQEEKDLFMRLSVFRGLFSREAAQAVAGPFKNHPGHCVFSDIVRKSLVKIDPGTGLFELHALVCQFAKEKLFASGLLEKTLDKHEYYYLNLARRGEKELIGPDMQAYRTDMDRAFTNIEQAWKRALDRGDITGISQCAVGLYIYFDMHTQYLNAEQFFRDAESLLVDLDRHFCPEAGLLLLCWFDMQNQSVNRLKSFETIRAFACKWLRWSVKSGDTPGRAHALVLLGAIAQKKKEHARAVRLYQLSLAQDPGVERAFWVTMRMGICQRARGMMDQALTCFEKSIGIGRDFGDATKIAWALGNAGAAHICLGNCESARHKLLAAKDIFTQIKALLGQIFCLEELGFIALLQGRFDQALALANQAVDLSYNAGVDLYSHQCPTALKGMALIMKEDVDQALICFQEIENAGVLGFAACLGMGFIAVCRNNPLGAAFYEKKARSLTTSVHKPQFIPLLYLLKAGIFSLNKDKALAAGQLNLALEHPFCPKNIFDAWPFACKITDQARHMNQ